MKDEVEKTAVQYDYDNVCMQYIKYFEKEIKHKELVLDETDNELYNKVLDIKFRAVDDKSGNNEKKATNTISKKSKKIVYKIMKIVPRGIKNKMKKIIEKLYNFINSR